MDTENFLFLLLLFFIKNVNYNQVLSLPLKIQILPDSTHDIPIEANKKFEYCF